MLKIDGEEWSGKVIVEAIGEDAEPCFDGDEAYTQAYRLYSGEPIGTRYSHRVTVRRNPATSAAEWDRFFRIISAPQKSHIFELPHDQGSLTYEGKIRTASRELERQIADIDVAGNVLNVWGDLISLEVVPLEIQREAD